MTKRKIITTSPQRPNRQALAFVAVVAGLAGAYLLATSFAASVTGERSNRTNLSFTSAGYTSTYHLYAAGLDWTKRVGLMVYADGSGEYGLKNPSSSYLLGGTNGLIAVAKKHNMVLLTPLSPNPACADGGGSCWYQGDPTGYVKWAENLVQEVEAAYPIDKGRVAFGGYSSGAQLATEYWIPSGAAQRTMSDGVVVAISFGGSPKMTQTTYTGAFKANIPINWNTGDQDAAYTTSSAYGVKAGYASYTQAGFKTSLDLVAGLGHGRSGTFGPVMDAQIAEHVPVAGPAASSSPAPSTAQPPSRTPQPSTAPSVPGDLNGDGRVNVLDLSKLLSSWGTAGGDVTGDGSTNVLDLSKLLTNWTR